jgi:hypothetical protein
VLSAAVIGRLGKWNSKQTLLIFWIASLTSHAGICQSQTFTWTGAGPDNNWSTASNWAGGTSPLGSDTTELTFIDASLRGSVFQDISSPFVLRLLEIETVNGGFTMDGSPLDFRSDSGNSFLYFGGPNPVIVNQDWQINSNLSTWMSRTNGVGSGLMIHNGQIGGTGELQLLRNSMILTGNVSGLSTVNVGLESVLKVDGVIDSSVGTVLIGNNPANAHFEQTLTGSGTINSNIQLWSGVNVISSSSTLNINGSVFSIGGEDGGTLYSVHLDSGTINVNGDIRNAALNIRNGAVLAGTGELSIRRTQLHVDGRINSDRTIIIDAVQQGDGQVFGEGVIDAGITIRGGAIRGGLTINGDVLFQGGILSSSLGDAFGGNSPITINGNVVFDRTVTVYGPIRGVGQLITNSGNWVQYAGDISEVHNVVRGEVVAFDSVFSDTSTISLEGGTLTLPGGNNRFDAFINSIGQSEIRSNFQDNFFNGSIQVESGSLIVSGLLQGTGSLVIQDGAEVTIQSANSSIRLNVVNEGLIDGTVAKATIDSNLTSRGGEFQGLFDVTGTMTVESGLQSVLRSGADGLVEGEVLVTQSALSIQAGAVLRGPESLIVNGGQLSVNGEVRRNTVIDASSLLTGSGLFFGEMTVDGVLDPGNSAGTVGVDGSLTLGETSVVTVEIGGSTPGTYDVIDGRGVSVLNLQGGGLDLQFIDGFVPEAAMDFDIFQNFAAINGRFGDSFFGGDGGGDGNQNNNGGRYYFDRGSFAIEYGVNFIRLNDFQAAIPEPSGLIVWSALGLGLTTVRRRRSLAASCGVNT